MKGKTKDCFTPHIYMHSLFGLGLGILIASLWSGISKWWIGVIAMVIAVILDASRKA